MFIKYLLVCLASCVLMSFTPCKVASSSTNDPLVVKGKTSTGTHLVEKIWSLIQHHRWDSLESRMDKHFSGIDLYGTLTSRHEEIHFLKNLDIQTASPYVLKVTSPHKHVLVVQYAVELTTAELGPDTGIPGIRMSVFKKTDGKWLWTSDADFNVLVEPQSE